MLGAKFFITVVTATSVAAAPLFEQIAELTQAISPIPIINIPAVSTAVRVIAGDTTCPVSTGGLANVNAFVAVRVKEEADITVRSQLAVPFFLNEVLRATAHVDLEIAVCLCVDIGVYTNVLPPLIQARAKADVEAYVAALASAQTNIDLGILQAQSSIDVAVNFVPRSTTHCTCAPNEIPGCANGSCICTPCPPPLVYNPNTGTCTPVPSNGPGRRWLAGSAAPLEREAVALRQAKRADIVRRLSNPFSGKHA